MSQLNNTIKLLGMPRGSLKGNDVLALKERIEPELESLQDLGEEGQKSGGGEEKGKAGVA